MVILEMLKKFEKSMKALHMIAFLLLVVGGLNWLLHAFNYNLVDLALGEGSVGAQAVYVLVGLAAILEVVAHKKGCKMCDSGRAAM